MARVTLKEAIALLNKAHGIDPEKAGRDSFCIQTLYNAINTKRIKRFGPRHMATVDPNEVLNVFGPKQTG